MSKSDKYKDARVLTSFNPNDPKYKQHIAITIGPNRESKNWRPDDKTPDVATFVAHLAQHPEDKHKDGWGFVGGEMAKGRRLKNAVKALYVIGLDLDRGTSPDVIDDALVKLGKLALRYTTHSNGATAHEFKRDEVHKFAPGEEIDTALMRRFLAEKKGWRPAIVKSATYTGQDHDTRGLMVQVAHAPMPKNRVVIPLATPFKIADYSTLKEAEDAWRKIVVATADHLGLRDAIDMTGVDLCRLFYLPRHAPDTPHDTALCGGDLFDWRNLVLDDPNELLAREGSKATGKSKTPEGKALGAWASAHADGFQIVDVLDAECPERIRNRSGIGVEIECPNDADHSDAGNPDDRACLAINSGDGTAPVFTIKCQHDSCRDMTNLDMLGRMIADGWFAREVIDSDDYNALGESEKAKTVPAGETVGDVFDFYEEKKLVEEIDAICRVIALGGKRRFAVLGREREPQFLTRADAAVELAQYKLWRNRGTKDDPDWVSSPGFDIWLASSKRKSNFDGAEFNPGGVREGILNLWTGFAVNPAPGDWSLLRAHIRENICQENEEHFKFLMGWLAQLFREPGRKSGVAVVLRGDIGVGKTKLFEWIGNIIGDRHALVADKSEQCTGKFNAQLEQNIFVSAEEAFFAGDPAQGRALKHLITGHKLMYEPKGRDAYMGRSCSRLGMTTNEHWAVAAVRRERRYLILDVAATRQKDGAYFAAIDKQMENGGAGAMLLDLLAHDYSEVDFQNPPVTDALKDIIQRGIDSNEKWLQSVLEEGRFPVRQDSQREETEWESGGCEIAKSKVVASYNDFVPSFKKVPATSQDVWNFFAKSKITGVMASKMSDGMGGRVPSWKLPPLEQARANFTDATGYGFGEAARDDDNEEEE